MSKQKLMKSYRITLPIPPTTNHFHIPVIIKGKPRLITNPKVKAYQRELCLIIRSLGLHTEQIDQRIVVDFTLYPKTKAVTDVSNYLKAYEDGLKKSGFIVDDHWIEYGSVIKGEVSPKSPRIELVINV